MLNGVQARLGLAAALCALGTLTTPAGARVIYYDNFDGTFHWQQFGIMPGKYLDITQPPTQSGAFTPLGLRMVTPPPATGTDYKIWSFAGQPGGATGAFVGRCGATEFKPTTVTTVYTVVPPRAYAPTEMIGPQGDWNLAADFLFTAGPYVFGPKATLGVQLRTVEGVRYGWVYLERIGATVFKAKAWAYETEFDTPIAAYGAADADGILNVPSEYPTVRDAANAVNSGQTILVANGTYSGIGCTGLDFSGKAITLRSAGGPLNCIIDAGAAIPTRGFRFRSGEGPGTIIDGFTIRNCRAWGFLGTGGAMLIEQGSSPRVTHCIFQDNRGGSGSGGDSAFGGAIHVAGTSSPVIENCLFTGNHAQNGAALSNSGAATIVNCTFTLNDASGAPPDHSTVIGGSGPGSMTNCIVYGNSYPAGGASINPATTMAITSSCIEGGFAGAGNISSNPMFVGPTDYRLSAGSPCIDAASNPAVPASMTTDLGGQPRFRNDPATPDTGVGPPPVIDMGAFEFQPPFALADLNQDGHVDGFDLASLLAAWTGAATYSPCPGFIAADLNFDCRMNGLDLAALLAAWAP